MRFSGHETFSIREGWLYKGLHMLIDEPDKLHDPRAADYLGVGSNMAKSIRHWLQATELAQPHPEQRGRLEPTDFARVVFEHDPYFIETATWWLLHINLISTPIYADTWYWFFNSFNLERFDRSVVVENLRQYIQLGNKRAVSVNTLERDVACLLSSYSRSIPADHGDPEEARDCPFRDLGLLSHYRSSGYYQMHHRPKPIPPCVFGYCLSKAYEDAGKGDIAVQRLIRDPGGPGRAFVLTSESLYETLVHVMNSYDDIRIHGHAGQRAVSVPGREPVEWAKEMYVYGGVLN